MLILVLTTSLLSTADKEFLNKQKAVLQLLVHITQPNVYPELAELGRKYDVFNSAEHYRNAKAFENFVASYKQGILPRGEIFNVYNDDYLDQAIALFDLFYFAKDFDTFLYVSTYQPKRVNVKTNIPCSLKFKISFFGSVDCRLGPRCVQ